MADQLFREKSLERISSPEQLNDYLKVTKPAVWIVLLSVIFLITGFIIWGALTYIGSYAEGKAEVIDGKMTVRFDDTKLVGYIKNGMEVTVNEEHGTITGINFDQDGRIVAKTDLELEDGTYNATVCYKKTQVLGLLFGN